MKTFNVNPSDLLYFFYYESLRRVCRRFYLSPRVPQALGRWEFSVFSFTIQIWYDKWRRHDFSIKTHLSANENALIKNCVLQESVKSFLTLNFTLYSRIDIVLIHFGKSGWVKHILSLWTLKHPLPVYFLNCGNSQCLPSGDPRNPF